MKGILKLCGCLGLIAALLFFVMAVVVDNQAQGTKVSTGAVVNGQYVEIGSGYMTGSGYNGTTKQAKEDVPWMKGIAIVSGIVSIGMLIGAASIGDDNNEQY